MEKYKKERNVEIGKWGIRDKRIPRILNEGLERAKREFLSINNLHAIDSDRDSVYVEKRANVLSINKWVNFNETVYGFRMRHLGITMLHSTDQNEIILKGLGKKKESYEPFLNWFKKLIVCRDAFDQKMRFRIMRTEISNYVNKKLDIEVYRELNQNNGFRYIKRFEVIGQDFVSSVPVSVDLIDISYNFQFVRHLIQELDFKIPKSKRRAKRQRRKMRL